MDKGFWREGGLDRQKGSRPAEGFVLAENPCPWYSSVLLSRASLGSIDPIGPFVGLNET
jgi:hypothetical protein